MDFAAEALATDAVAELMDDFNDSQRAPKVDDIFRGEKIGVAGQLGNERFRGVFGVADSQLRKVGLPLESERSGQRCWVAFVASCTGKGSKPN